MNMEVTVCVDPAFEPEPDPGPPEWYWTGIHHGEIKRCPGFWLTRQHPTIARLDIARCDECGEMREIDMEQVIRDAQPRQGRCDRAGR